MYSCSQALADPIPNELRRITVFCIAETLDAKQLDTLIKGQAGGYTSQVGMVSNQHYDCTHHE